MVCWVQTKQQHISYLVVALGQFMTYSLEHKQSYQLHLMIKEDVTKDKYLLVIIDCRAKNIKVHACSMPPSSDDVLATQINVDVVCGILIQL